MSPCPRKGEGDYEPLHMIFFQFELSGGHRRKEAQHPFYGPGDRISDQQRSCLEFAQHMTVDKNVSNSLRSTIL